MTQTRNYNRASNIFLICLIGMKLITNNKRKKRNFINKFKIQVFYRTRKINQYFSNNVPATCPAVQVHIHEAFSWNLSLQRPWDRNSGGLSPATTLALSL